MMMNTKKLTGKINSLVKKNKITKNNIINTVIKNNFKEIKET